MAASRQAHQGGVATTLRYYFNLQVSLVLLLMLAVALNAPSLLVWAKNFQ